MTNSELTDLIVHLHRMTAHDRYVPLLVWGEAGIGKSETVKAAADRLDIDFVDLRLGNLEATDLMGLMRDETVYPCSLHLEGGTIDALRAGERFTGAGLWHHVLLHHRDQIPKKLEADPEGFVEWNADRLKKMGYSSLIETRTVYSAPAWFPAPDTSGILFLDEMNRSQHETRQGVFQLVLDRRIHELELPRGWIIVSANNPPSSTDTSGLRSYDVDELDDKAFLNRFCHVVLSATPTEWANYAREAGVDATIRTLLSPANEGDERVRKLLGMRGAENPELEPTPRGWVMLGQILDSLPEDPFRSERTLTEVTEGILGTQISIGEKASVNISREFLESLEKRSLGLDLEILVDMAADGDPTFPEKKAAFVRQCRTSNQEDQIEKLEQALREVGAPQMEPAASNEGESRFGDLKTLLGGRR